MKLPALPEHEVRFEMIAMMDIVFQLIAFFMIVSTFIVLEKIEVDLPVAENSALAENQQGRLLISISADGALWLGAHPISLEDLAAVLASQSPTEPAMRVVIRSDRTAAYALVKQVMKTCRDAGLSDLIFASYQSGN